jgi:dynein heavy chain 1, cytosolic
MDVASAQTPIPGTTNGVVSSSLVAIDPVRIVDYLAALLEATLGATRQELESTDSLLSKARYQDTLQQCTRFATDSQVALYIQKSLAATNATENGNSEQRATPGPVRCVW